MLAGGVGSRLYPISTPSIPKQFLKVHPDLSLLQSTLKRFLKVTIPEHLFIITSESLKQMTTLHASAIDPILKRNILIEPAYKNTGFAIAWGIWHLQSMQRIHDNTTIIVTPADHVFFAEDAFLSDLCHALKWRSENTFSVLAAFPTHNTKEFGYLCPGKKINPYYRTCLGFIEKPHTNIAHKLIGERWLWNMGIYLFNAALFWKELCSAIRCDMKEDLELVLKSLPSLSIDYVLMEKTAKLCIYSVEHALWSDVGSIKTLMYCKEHLTQAVHT